MASIQHWRSTLLPLALSVVSTLLLAESKRATVDQVAHPALRVTTSAGTGLLPIYVSSDWSRPQPGVTRAIVIFHGKKRNAEKRGSLRGLSAESAKIGGCFFLRHFLRDDDAAARFLRRDYA